MDWKKIVGTAMFIIIFGYFYISDSSDLVFEEPVSQQEIENHSVLSEESSAGEFDDLQDEPESIVIHIAGDVRYPGVYEVTEGTRLDAVLQMAGPLDMLVVDKFFNRAEKLYDGQKFFIPTAEEAAGFLEQEAGSIQQPQVLLSQHPQTLASSQDGRININTAGASELMKLPGIGEKKAAEIINYRESIGNFKKIDDIINVTGIGQATFDNIKDRITV